MRGGGAKKFKNEAQNDHKPVRWDQGGWLGLPASTSAAAEQEEEAENKDDFQADVIKQLEYFKSIKMISRVDFNVKRTCSTFYIGTSIKMAGTSGGDDALPWGSSFFIPFSPFYFYYRCNFWDCFPCIILFVFVFCALVVFSFLGLLSMRLFFLSGLLYFQCMFYALFVFFSFFVFLLLLFLFGSGSHIEDNVMVYLKCGDA